MARLVRPVDDVEQEGLRLVARRRPVTSDRPGLTRRLVAPDRLERSRPFRDYGF